MGPRPAAAAVLALLAVTAGCAAVFGPPSTPTPAADSTATADGSRAGESTSTPTLRVSGPPPGLGAAGVEDAEALAEAHAAALRNRSFAMRRLVLVRDADGSRIGRERAAARVSSGGDRYSYEWSVEGVVGRDLAGRQRRTWSNRSVTYVATTWGASTSYRRYETATGRSPLPTIVGAAVVREAFGLVDTRVTDVERSGGTVRYELSATGGPHEHPGRNVSLRATVEASGLVRSLTLRYWSDANGGEVRVVRRLRIGGLGETTVPRPAWVDRAVENTSAG